MLWIIQEKHLLDILDGGKKRNKDVYCDIEEELKKKNIFKTGIQIRAKFKALKRQYYIVKRNNLTSGAARKTCQLYNILDEILSDRLVAVASVSGVDTSNDLESPTDITVQSDETDDVAEEAVEIEVVPEITKSSKKKSYQKSVSTFIEEWKTTQEKLVQSLNKQNDNFLKEMKKNFKEEEEMLKKEKEESQAFLKEIAEKFLEP